MGSGRAGRRRPVRRTPAVPAWTLATVFSMVVATAGIQEIASRVAAPVHLDGRAGQGLDAPLSLASRPIAPPRPERVPATPEEDPGEAGRVPGGPAAGVAPTPSRLVPELPPAPAPPLGDWVVDNADGGATRWAPGGPGDAELWRLEHETPLGGWQEGYGDSARVALTSPWLPVPVEAANPGIALWARTNIEPGYDVLHVAWSAGDEWVEAGTLSLFGGDLLRLHEFRLPAPVGSPRVRVRLTFTSDFAGSSATFAEPGMGVWIEGVAVRELQAPVSAYGRPRPGTPGPVADEARAVVAISGNGIQPYHQEFRDDSPRAYAHPSTYLDGYPEDAIALWLSLDAPTLEIALERDAEIWDALVPGQLYWVPGTRIIGMRASVGGYTTCTQNNGTGGLEEGPCILDNGWQWWGTAAASVAVGERLGACPECLLVATEGYGGDEIAWAADQAAWVDLHAVVERLPTGLTALSPWGKRLSEVRSAAERQLVLATAGGGLWDEVNWTTFAAARRSPPLALGPAPGSWSWPGGVPGVVAVGLHDHGHVALQNGHGPELLVEGCGLPVARGTMDGRAEPDGFGHRYAAAAAAGRIGDALLRVRREVGDHHPGSTDGALVKVAARPGAGPLADGRLDLDELLGAVRATAVTPAVGEQACGVGDEYELAVPVPIASLPPQVRPTVMGFGDPVDGGELAAALLGRADLPGRPWAARWNDVREQERDAWYEATTRAYDRTP